MGSMEPGNKKVEGDGNSADSEFCAKMESQMEEQMLAAFKGKKLFKEAAETRHDFFKAAKKAKVPGCIAEDPSKTVVVTFK